MANGNITTTLQTVVNLAATQVDLLPLSGVGGYTSEPALSLCNDVLQELLSAPFEWKFNRTELPMFVTAPNRQDYLFAGASAFTLGSRSRGAGIGLAATPAISESGFTVTVNTLEAHGFSAGDTVYMVGNTVAAYNSTLTQDDSSGSVWSGGWVILTVPTTTSFTFTHATGSLAVSGAAGITDFRWGTSGSMVEVASTSYPQRTLQIQYVNNLPVLSRVADPSKVTVISDPGTGILKIRLSYIPSSTAWGISLVYQAKAPLKTALSDKWGPFPDEFSYVYRQGFLAHAYRYINSAKADVEYQKFQQKIQKALTQGDSEQNESRLAPSESLMSDEYYFFY